MQIAPVCKILGMFLMLTCLRLPCWAQQDSAAHAKQDTAAIIKNLFGKLAQQDTTIHDTAGYRKSIYGKLAQLDTGKQAKQDTVKRGIVHYLQTRKGMFGKLAQNLVGEPVGSDLETQPVRNDLPYVPYEGKIIRNIAIQRLDFGTLITDTAHNFKNTFTNLANDLHHKSREYVIRNNLFFKKGDRLVAFLLADNERHLRDQPYVQDAKFIIIPLYQSDSVDILVRTKDVLSLGGSFELSNTKSFEATLKEENVAGGGNGLMVGMLYNQMRRQETGYQVRYTNRNIFGSFIDATVGYSTYANTLNTLQKEEQFLYAQVTRPLINPYSRWTYSFEIAQHTTQNMFWADSFYKAQIKYDYFNYDAWAGLNTGAYRIGNSTGNDDDRMRTLVSLRYFKQRFLDIPDAYLNNYLYIYADITGVLGSVSIFKQNFYKAQYFYGFGRNEDVPEGVDMSLTAGWVNKQNINRPYIGLDLQRYFFTANKEYYNFTFRSGTFWGSKKPEDFNMLLSMDRYSRVVNFGGGWKQRSQINASITGQINKVLNAPLALQSQYGLDEWKASTPFADADFRATLRGESVFFSPFTFINFHFAPFVFGNLCMITPIKQSLDKSDLYSSIGGGIRTRNESLIFGTFELKVFYFPRKTFTGEAWRIETTTGIKFKYNSQYIKKPTLINVN